MWILIIILAGAYNQPAITTIQFSTAGKCYAAAELLSKKEDLTRIETFCVER